MMECALREEPSAVELPAGYVWVPWSSDVLERHATVLFHSFRDTVDAEILPSLASLVGCRMLLHRLAQWRGFCPSAQCLVGTETREDAACLQAVLDVDHHGVIINVAVLPGHRGRGLGTALLRRALRSLFRVGARRVYLEVTASNVPAMRLYRRHGFRCYKTFYRELPDAGAAITTVGPVAVAAQPP